MNAWKERSYVFSTFGGKQHPGSCFFARWLWRHSQQKPFWPQLAVHVHRLTFLFWFLQSDIFV